MASTYRELYQTALHLMGEPPAPSSHYDARALPGINMILGDLYLLDLALKGEKGSVSGEPPVATAMTQTTNLSPILARAVLPLGLAAFLLNEEEEKRAAFFYQVYRQEKEILLRSFAPARRHSIKELY